MGEGGMHTPALDSVRKTALNVMCCRPDPAVMTEKDKAST
jgi:hypothetical protein